MRMKCEYGGEEFTVEADMAQAAAPIYVDGSPIGYQVADCRHRADIAVAIAANHLFSLNLPEAPAGVTPDEWQARIAKCPEWAEISFYAFSDFA